MRKNIKLTFIITVLTVIFSCSKEENCENPIDCLPTATQKGANTFGCLINGQIFKPGGTQLGGPTLDANYLFYEGYQYFDLAAVNNKNNPNISVGLFIVTNELEEGKTYVLKSDQNSSEHSFARLRKDGNRYETNEQNIGELKIEKFDSENGIVSGTFWFDAINNDEIIEIREGRFDLKL